MLLGDNLGWKEGFDALGLVDEWHEGQASHISGLYANGPVASLVAGYVMSMRQGPAPEFAVFRNGLTSYRELLDPEVPDWAILPRALFSVDMMQPFYDSSTNDVHSWIVDPLSKASVPPKVHVVTLEELLSSEW